MNGAISKKYCYFSSLSESAINALSKKLQSFELPASTEIIKDNKPAVAFYLVKKRWGLEI